MNGDFTASSIGVTEATESLHVLVTRVVDKCDIGNYENPLNDPIRSALDELRGKRRLLDLSVAIRLAEISSSNARMGALYMITAHGSRQALDYLVKRYSVGDEERSIILEGIEQLSSRLELTVVREGEGLRILTEPAHSATVIDSNSLE